MQKDLFTRASENLKKNSHFTEKYDDFKEKIEKGGFVYVPWAGSAADEAAIKQETKATVRCIPFTSEHAGGICIKTGKKTKTVAVFARSY